jgi:hypothetical protein
MYTSEVGDLASITTVGGYLWSLNTAPGVYSNSPGTDETAGDVTMSLKTSHLAADGKDGLGWSRVRAVSVLPAEGAEDHDLVISALLDQRDPYHSDTFELITAVEGYRPSFLITGTQGTVTMGGQVYLEADDVITLTIVDGAINTLLVDTPTQITVQLDQGVATWANFFTVLLTSDNLGVTGSTVTAGDVVANDYFKSHLHTDNVVVVTWPPPRWPATRPAPEWRLPRQKCSTIRVGLSATPATARWAAIRLDVAPLPRRAPAPYRK